MNQIKFSHNYFKLDGYLDSPVPFVTLLEVLNVNIEELSKTFLEYDCVYENDKGDKDYYQLPEKGKFLLLLFWHNDGLFTTIRRWTDQKEYYYRKQIGEKFKVVMT